MMPADKTNHSVFDRASEFSVSRHVIFAVTVIAGLLFGIGGWAATANLTGAVIASGQFVVERNVKKVQHMYGGIVEAINVKAGDRVVAGDILLRLDATQIRAELGVVRSQLVELVARSARLTSERDGLREVIFPAGFVASSPEAKAAADSEVRLFDEARKAKESQKEQLRLKIEQTKDEISGLMAQRHAKNGELDVVKGELNDLRDLHAKKLTTKARLNSLERDEKRLSGDIGALVAQVARANGLINELHVQILTIDENVRAAAQRELRATEARLVELTEREIASKDKLHRIDIRAPRTGLVHELTVHTVGGVITPAEQLMLIVPEEDSLTIQARVMPNEIDQVKIGRQARLRLTAFNQQKTPEVDGYVVHVAGDVTTDPKTGQSYYVVRIEMDDKARKVLGELKLVPGMPVEVFMSTGERTALSYLAKPFVDQMKRAFRE
jgi:HlyD family secretion protein